MDSALWIILAVVAVLIVVGVLLLVSRRRNTQLHGKAEHIRRETRQEAVKVDQRAALAKETEARARAAEAEAEAKAAEAERLAGRAQEHRSAADTSRQDLDARLQHADSIDPKVKATDRTQQPQTEDPPRAR